jgi:hypothetical protein
MATANFGISVAAWLLGFSRQLRGHVEVSKGKCRQADRCRWGG